MNRAGLTGIAARIAEMRAAKALSLNDIGEQLRINGQWAHHLEVDDDELPMTLSLGQVCDLATVLGLSPRGLVVGDTIPIGISSPESIVQAIQAHLSARRITADEFGDAVGWDIKSVLNEPNRIWSDWNIDEAHDVCAALGIDWRTLLPVSNRGAV